VEIARSKLLGPRPFTVSVLRSQECREAPSCSGLSSRCLSEIPRLLPVSRPPNQDRFAEWTICLCSFIGTGYWLLATATATRPFHLFQTPRWNTEGIEICFFSLYRSALGNRHTDGPTLLQGCGQAQRMQHFQGLCISTRPSPTPHQPMGFLNSENVLRSTSKATCIRT
jgi:hypothetical protein